MASFVRDSIPAMAIDAPAVLLVKALGPTARLAMVCVWALTAYTVSDQLIRAGLGGWEVPGNVYLLGFIQLILAAYTYKVSNILLDEDYRGAKRVGLFIAGIADFSILLLGFCFACVNLLISVFSIAKEPLLGATMLMLIIGFGIVIRPLFPSSDD